MRQSQNYIEENDDDLEYLSRFKVTRKCVGEIGHSWWEYIEPLSVHARHPHSLQCWRLRDNIPESPTLPSVSKLTVDYVLLQTRNDILGNFHHIHNSQHNQNHSHPSRFPPKEYSPHSFMFDAGTSRFDSSLYWFLCAYEQVNIII